MRKRLLVILLSMAVLFTFMPMTAYAMPDGTWIETSGGLVYELEDGSYYTGWLEDNDYYYYLQPGTGFAATGWKKIGGYWYYFAKNGDENNYEKGQMYDDGAIKIGGKWYYVGPWPGYDKGGTTAKWGKLQYGWIKESYSDEEYAWYYGDPNKDGQLALGWKKINGKWYYFETEAEEYLNVGQMYADNIFTINGKRYCFSKNGDLRTGWIKNPNWDEWYYADPANDSVLTEEWKKINGYWYYFDPTSLVMYADTTDMCGSKKFYAFDKSGKLHEKAGWLKLSSGWVYTDKNGVATSGWKKIDGYWYFFSYSGYMERNTFVSDSKGTCWLDKDGHITKDKWIKFDDEWYYIKSNGYMAVNEWAKDKTGWMHMDGHGNIEKDFWFYDNANGEWYYLKPDGYMAANEWAVRAGDYYWMQANGKSLKNSWLQIGNGGPKYYLDEYGVRVTGEYYIDGICYHFDEEGRLIS